MVLYPRPSPFLGEVLAHSLSTSGTGHMGPILGPRSLTGDLVDAQWVVAPISTYKPLLGTVVYFGLPGCGTSRASLRICSGVYPLGWYGL